MGPQHPTCAILADRHTALADGIRGLLETEFDAVYVVADTQSLSDGAQRLLPELIIIDLGLVSGDLPGQLHRIADLAPASRVIVLSMHDEAGVAQLALAAGAHGVVLKRCVGNDFLPAIDAVLHGRHYVSPDFRLTTPAG